jgi:TatD DNase family protein
MPSDANLPPDALPVTPFVDTHCHLDYLVRGRDVAQSPGDDEVPSTGQRPEDVLARAQEAGLQWLVNPGVQPKHYAQILALAERFEPVWAALAVHPTDVHEATPDDAHWQATLETALDHPKVVALGETGLDFYHSQTHVETQLRWFRYTLALAQRLDKPVIIHDRDAHEAVASTLAEYPGVRGVMHCFSGDAAFARRMIDMGFYISFAGNVTFKNAHALREAAAAVPPEWLLVETDAPFLSPVPYRGQVNEPARVAQVLACLAEVKGLSYEALARQTTQNAACLFGLPAAVAGQS